jgi:hypothetical protein
VLILAREILYAGLSYPIFSYIWYVVTWTQFVYVVKYYSTDDIYDKTLLVLYLEAVSPNMDFWNK